MAGWSSMTYEVEQELERVIREETAAGDARRAPVVVVDAVDDQTVYERVVDERRIRDAMEAAVARRQAKKR